MNGISMENPFALLMNLGVGMTPDLMTPGLGQNAAITGDADLLGFVNMLEVSQGPQSPIGENVDQMVGELVRDDFEAKKQAESSEGSSVDLLTAMSQPSKVFANIDTNATPSIKTNGNNDVGHSVKPKALPGETMLLGDLMMAKAPNAELIKAKATGPAGMQTNKVETADVAAWSQAFAQNDIQSIDLVEEKPNFDKANLDKPNAAKPVIFEQETKREVPVVISTVKPKVGTPKSAEGVDVVKLENHGEAKVTSGFQRIAPEKVEANLSLLESAPSKTREKSEKNENSEKMVSSVDASELILGRQVLMDSSNNQKVSGSAFQSASSLGSSLDTRLSSDSVKMLADKIDAIKDSGSSTLRVVVNPDEMGKIEIRVQKVNGEIKVSLSSDSKDVVRVLEDSRTDLMSRLSGRVQVSTLEIGTEIQKSMMDSSHGLAVKSSMPSADVLKLGQTQDSKPTLANSDFGASSSGFRNQDHREQQGREESRDRGMRKWQGVFEDRESA